MAGSSEGGWTPGWVDEASLKSASAQVAPCSVLPASAPSGSRQSAAVVPWVMAIRPHPEENETFDLFKNYCYSLVDWQYYVSFSCTAQRFHGPAHHDAVTTVSVGTACLSQIWSCVSLWGKGLCLRNSSSVSPSRLRPGWGRSHRSHARLSSSRARGRRSLLVTCLAWNGGRRINHEDYVRDSVPQIKPEIF